MSLAFRAAAVGSGLGVTHVGRRWVAGAGGSAVPLAYEEFRSAPVGDSKDSGGEERTVVVLHGLLGSARNWRSTCKQLADRCSAERRGASAYRILAVDLRHHGRTHLLAAAAAAAAGGEGEGSTMSSAAADVLAVLRSVGPVDAVLGHSLGGKIAMALVRDHLYGAGACAAVREGGHVWVLDSQPRAQAPGAGETDVMRVLRAVQEYAGGGAPIDRARFRTQLEGRGFGAAIVNWLVSSGIRRRRRAGPGGEGQYELTFDIHGAQDLLRDYMRQDYMDVLRRPPPGVRVHHMRGSVSDRFSPADIAELDGAAAAADGFCTHVLEGAGHWLHHDAPRAFVDAIAPRLARIGLRPGGDGAPPR